MAGKRDLPTDRDGYGDPALTSQQDAWPHKVRDTLPATSRLVSLRHHKLLWLGPVVLLAAALLPLPYGYYTLLRLAICAVSAWIAYEQWRHDDAFSGWVVVFAGVALLYNPIVPVHLSRDIWSVLNLASAGLFLGHLGALSSLTRHGDERASEGHGLRSEKGAAGIAYMGMRKAVGQEPATSRGRLTSHDEDKIELGDSLGSNALTQHRDWPSRFTQGSVAAAQAELSDLGISTNVTVLPRDEVRFDEDEVVAGSALIDCEAPARYRRDYPDLQKAISNGSWLKRLVLVRYPSHRPFPPGVKRAQNPVTLTNASRAHIRLCRDSEQQWAMHQTFILGDSGVPTFYVSSGRELSEAVRVVGNELTMSPAARRLRGFAAICQDLAMALCVAIFGLLFLLGCCLTLVAVVFGLGQLVGLW